MKLLQYTLVCSWLVMVVAVAGAQDQKTEDSTQPAKKTSSQKTLPSLDDLLGIDKKQHDKTSPGSTAIPGTDANASKRKNQTGAQHEELVRLLSGKEIVDEFQAAIDLMSQSAARLEKENDPGLTTQRMQERVLRKLDKLIADAKERSKQQNGSSSSSSSKTKPQSQAQQQPAQKSQSKQAGNKENNGQVNPPAGSKAAPGPEHASDLAAWGKLPARLRDALAQGAGETFSATYRALTEAYYRKLAEEPKK